LAILELGRGEEAYLESSSRTDRLLSDSTSTGSTGFDRLQLNKKKLHIMLTAPATTA